MNDPLRRGRLTVEGCVELQHVELLGVHLKLARRGQAHRVVRALAPVRVAAGQGCRRGYVYLLQRQGCLWAAKQNQQAPDLYPEQPIWIRGWSAQKESCAGSGISTDAFFLRPCPAAALPPAAPAPLR